jgi:undecaprenyl diphosphate synthase
MHIGIIMDGNRRWAKQRSLNVTAGHSEGAKTLEKIVELAAKYNISEITTYALSTENYKGRAKMEIDFLLRLVDRFAREKLKTFIDNKIRVKFLGDIDDLPQSSINTIKKLEDETEEFTDLKLNLCLNYGGRQELVRAVKKLVSNNQEISEKSITENLDLKDEPQLIVRTGGHRRLSNFLLWQSSYAELYFTDVLWPDFNEEELKKAIEFYKQQQRNFGK